MKIIKEKTNYEAALFICNQMYGPVEIINNYNGASFKLSGAQAVHTIARRLKASRVPNMTIKSNSKKVVTVYYDHKYLGNVITIKRKGQVLSQFVYSWQDMTPSEFTLQNYPQAYIDRISDRLHYVYDRDTDARLGKGITASHAWANARHNIEKRTGLVSS